MLIYGDRIGAVARGLVPPGDGTPDDDFPTRIQASLFGYVRGQVLFSLIMGTSAGLMLFFLGSVGIFPEGKTYAIAFGAWFGFAELIPYVGPAVGGFPPVVIAALSDNPIDAVWLIIAFTVLQQLEGHVVAPNVFGQALRINPLLVIFALLMGGQLARLRGRVHRAADRRDPARDDRLPAPPHDLPALGPAGRAAAAARPQTRCPECGVLGRRGRGGVPRLRDRARRSRRGGLGGRGRARMKRRRGRQALRGQAALRDVSFDAARGRARRDHRPQRRREDDAAADPRGQPGARRGRGRPPAGRVGPAARGGLRQADRAREPAALRAPREGAATSAWRACWS